MKVIKHRFQDSCMLHVQVPLMLGVFCGTVAYLSIFRVDERLPRQLVQIERGDRLKSALDQITKESSGKGPSIVKVVEAQDAMAIGKSRVPNAASSVQLSKKIDKIDDVDKLGSSKTETASHCEHMKKKFKSEDPAVVEFPMADDCGRWYQFAEDVRRCTVENLTNAEDAGGLNAWKRLRRVTECCSSGIYEMLSVTPLTKGSDTKFVVFPSSPTLPCYALSVGLLPDLSTARKLHEVLPQCEQYAAEANKKLGKQFEEIGEVHYVSLNPRAAKHAHDETDPDKSSDSAQANQTTFTDFLQSYIKVSEIDYVFINGREGEEFYILKWLLQQKKQKRERVPICFLTMDLHSPLERFGLDEPTFDKLILNFVQQSDFLILPGSARKAGRGSQRIFILNAYEPFCVEKYFGQWCKPAGD